MNERPMRNMNINEMRNDASETSLNPIRYDKNSIVTPCISAGVTPPNILPSTIELLFTGATIISFKNPNCLSHKTDIPENIDVKSMDIPTIPGTRNIEKAALPVPGKEILFRPNPKNARKKKGIENWPMILDFDLKKRFISLNHRMYMALVSMKLMSPPQFVF